MAKGWDRQQQRVLGGGGVRASQREKRWRGGGRKGTATMMGAGGCSMGVKRSPEVEDGGGDRLIWTASG